MVRNAASQRQVQRAGKQERFQRETELKELKELLQDARFRRFMWRMLDYTSVFRSIFEQSSKIYHNSGRQDVGHFLMGEIAEADEGSYLKMMQEHYVAAHKRVSADDLPQEDADHG